MATAPDWSCPICCEALEDIAYVTSCHHEFCLGCIVRWAKKNPSCPLCRRPVDSFIYSVRSNQEFLEMALPQPSGPSATSHQAEQGAAGSVPTAYVAGFPPKTWALFFRNYVEVLEPVQLWLNEVLIAPCWWDVALAQGRIISFLCRYGLHEELMVRELQPLLQEQTVAFVHQLIDVAVEQCYKLVQQLVRLHSSRAAEGQGDGGALQGMAAANASAQEQPPEELEQVVEDPSNAVARAPSRPGNPANREAHTKHVDGKSRVLQKNQKKPESGQQLRST